MKKLLLLTVLPYVLLFNLSTVSAQLTATITGQNNPLCNGGFGSATVTASGGTTPYTYAWSPAGGNSSTATGLSAGSYTVLVTDAASNTATATVNLTEPNAITAVSSSSNDVSCFGGNNGFLYESVSGGTPPYTYLWSPSGNTSLMATGLSAGTYTLTITDNNGCTGTAASTITQPSQISATGTSTPNASCITPNGTASAIVAGGTAPYKYTWSPTGQTNSTATALDSGIYVCIIKDAHNCIDTLALFVSGAGGPTLTLYSTPDSSSCNGTATAVVSGGTPGYHYSWSPGGQTNAIISGLCAGSYCCTVTDSHGCTDSSCINVVSTCTLGLTLSQTPVTCPNNGTATATPVGGVAPYTYTWSPGGGTTATITGLSAGTYSVTVQDSHACSANGNISVSSSSISYTIHGNPLYINAGDSTLLTAICNVPSTYAWAPSATLTSPNSDSTYAHPAGTTTYTVTITTPCGTFTDSVTINIQCFPLSMSSTPSYICSSSFDGTATVAALGGTPPYTYSWSPGGATTASISGLNAGNYSVIVHDFTGCSAMGTVTVASALANITASATPPTINVGDSSYLLASVPVFFTTYVWAPATGLSCTSCANPVATPTATTTYTVTATDTCGIVTDSVTVYVVACVNNYNEPICIVTVDTANKPVIFWGRTNSPPQSGYGSYMVYKETAPSIFTPIDNQPLNVLSDYVDAASILRSGLSAISWQPMTVADNRH